MHNYNIFSRFTYEINELKIKNIEIYGNLREFDPGSGWTLAVCLTHASRTKVLKTLVADGWVTRENLPFGRG